MLICTDGGSAPANTLSSAVEGRPTMRRSKSTS
jgi:hypothetical protein